MKKKVSKLIGLNQEDFYEFVNSSQIRLAEARLIPSYKIGDEMALSSIFLSALRLVKELRESIFSEIKLSKAGKAFYFTELSIPEVDSKSRLDGLIIVVSGGKIKDAVIFEMKNKNEVIESSQIERYQNLAKQLGINKIVTISNEFVSNPSNSPANIKRLKNFNIYHFSWTYLLTIAHLLLIKNDSNIEDHDQIEIMNEIVKYLERKESGVSGFNQMKPNWKFVVEKVLSGAALKENDKDVTEAVINWLQEEKDMALMLSRELGVLVSAGSTKNKDQDKLLKSNIKSLVKNHMLKSSLKVRGSVSDIKIEAGFDRRTIVMSVNLDAPLDKGFKGRCGWIIRQIQNCEKRQTALFKLLESELWIEIGIKYTNKTEQIKYTNIDLIYDLDKNKEITSFNIIVSRDFGKNFSSSKKFVEMIESMLLTFYGGIVQNLTNWERPAPKILDK